MKRLLAYLNEDVRVSPTSARRFLALYSVIAIIEGVVIRDDILPFCLAIGATAFGIALLLKNKRGDAKAAHNIRLTNAPGAKLLALVDFLFSPKTVEQTFK